MFGRMFTHMTKSFVDTWPDTPTVVGQSFSNRPGLCFLKIGLVGLVSNIETQVQWEKMVKKMGA